VGGQQECRELHPALLAAVVRRYRHSGQRQRVRVDECGPDLVDLPVFAYRRTQFVLVDLVGLHFLIGRERALGEHQEVVRGTGCGRARHRPQVSVATLDG